jgi:hypothetical protein
MYESSASFQDGRSRAFNTGDTEEHRVNQYDYFGGEGAGCGEERGEGGEAAGFGTGAGFFVAGAAGGCF